MNGALPVFDLAQGGWPLALARGLSVAALFSAEGALVFRWLVWARLRDNPGPETAGRLDARLVALVRISLAGQIAALLVWLVLQAAALADAATPGQALAAVEPVLAVTGYGRRVGAQLALAALVLLVLGRGERTGRWRAAALLAGLAVLIQAGHGHGYAMYDGPSLLLASDGVHLVAAAAWLGGLVPLLLVIASSAPSVGLAAAQRFSRLALLCVGALALTAAYQFWSLVGSLAGLVGTAYGWMALVKLTLFLGLVGLGAINRFRLVPALATGSANAARRHLARTIALETGLGLAILLAAAVLVELPPGRHTQPVWPFDRQPSLVTIEEDPEFRDEVIRATLALAVALAIAAAGIARRRWRWPALAAAAAIAWFALPHLDLLFVEAYPTSYYRSPTGFAARSIVAGAPLYRAQCVSCHGPEGRGDGPLARGLPVPPADLTAEHLWGHSDGELFWWLSHGIDAPEGGLAMPGFADRLSEPERWALIDYLRGRNAGLVHRATGGWAPPLKAPDIEAECAAGRTVTMAGLAGRVVRVVFAPDDPTRPAPAPLAEAGVEIVTLVVPPLRAALPPALTGLCIARDPTVRAAFAIVSGLAPDRLDGTQFLIDPNGWLRLSQAADEAVAGGWDDPATLRASAVEICRHPIALQGDAYAHHHGT